MQLINGMPSTNQYYFRYIRVFVLTKFSTTLLPRTYCKKMVSSFILTLKLCQWGADAFSSLFILDVASQSQKDYKVFSATYNLCSKKFCNKKIEGSSLKASCYLSTDVNVSKVD